MNTQPTPPKLIPSNPHPFHETLYALGRDLLHPDDERRTDALQRAFDRPVPQQEQIVRQLIHALRNSRSGVRRRARMALFALGEVAYDVVLRERAECPPGLLHRRLTGVLRDIESGWSSPAPTPRYLGLPENSR